MLGRGPGRWSPGDALRIRLLLGATFAALFALLVAIGSRWAGASEDAAVRLGAGSLLLGQLYWGLVVAGRISQLEAPEQTLFDPRLALFFRLLAFSSWAAQLTALSGLVPAATRAMFVYGLFLSLGYAALAFVRLLFIRPTSE